MTLNSGEEQPTPPPVPYAGPNPVHQPPRGGIWISGSIGLVIVVALIVLVVLAVGYFTVISVFGVPWYAAIPLSFVAGAGILVFEFSSSWKAWLLAAVLVALAGVAAFGWWFTDALG
jgi:hypothetical protein